MLSLHIENCMTAYTNGLEELALFWLRDYWIKAVQKGDVVTVTTLTDWFQAKNIKVGGPFVENK